MTQLYDALLVTRVSVTKLIGYRAAVRAQQLNSVEFVRCERGFSRPTTVQFITLRASTFLELSSMINIVWRDFLCPEYGEKFQREVALFL